MKSIRQLSLLTLILLVAASSIQASSSKLSNWEAVYNNLDTASTAFGKVDDYFDKCSRSISEEDDWYLFQRYFSLARKQFRFAEWGIRDYSKLLKKVPKDHISDEMKDLKGRIDEDIKQIQRCLGKLSEAILSENPDNADYQCKKASKLAKQCRLNIIKIIKQIKTHL